MYGAWLLPLSQGRLLEKLVGLEELVGLVGHCQESIRRTHYMVTPILLYQLKTYHTDVPKPARPDRTSQHPQKIHNPSGVHRPTHPGHPSGRPGAQAEPEVVPIRKSVFICKNVHS